MRLSIPLALFLISLLLLPSLALAQAPVRCDPKNPTASTSLCNPLKVFSFKEFIGVALAFYASITGLVTIVMVVFSGFRMIMSQGNEENLVKAKAAFKWSVLGFLLAILSFVLILAIIQALGVVPITEEDKLGLKGIFNLVGEQDLLDVILRMTEVFLQITGVLAVLIIIFNGFRYMTAGGNDEQVEVAKKGLQWALIGLATVLLAFVLIRALAALFGK